MKQQHIKKSLAALLLALSYLTSITSCASNIEAGYDSVKSESVVINGAAADYEYSMEAEMPTEDAIYDKGSGSTTGSSVANTGTNDLAARKLIMTADLSVETKQFDDFMATLESNIASAGAYIASSSISGSSYDDNRVRYANLTVRIPSDTYANFVSGVSGYGNVTHQSESVNDVTLAYVDTESRIKAYETEYATLLEILEKATSLDDVLIIQNRITEVTYQLESYRSQLRTYDDLISYCTVHINVREVVELTEIKKAPMTFGERISRGWNDTCEDVAKGAEDFAVWFVSSLPILVIWAVVILAAVLILRGAVRRRKAKRSKNATMYTKYQAYENKETEN